MLEEQVCRAAPFSAKAILPTHSQLIAVIAGFALAAFILLLTREDDTDEQRRGNVVGALLLGLASVIGLVGAFLFSSVSGDHCMNSMLQFDNASAIMAITALLMVAGISVAAGSKRQLSDTASALRVVLLIGALIMSYRFFNDYVRSDSVSKEYAAFLDRVTEINDELPPGEQLEPGSVATLDRQLELYAEERWPGRDEEWAGLLAEQFYRSPTSQRTLALMWVVVVVAIAWALAVRWVLGSARRRAPPAPADGGNARDEAGDAVARDGDDLAVAADRRAADVHVERLWRRWMSWLTLGGTSILVVLFSVSAGTGLLVHPGTWARILLFLAVTLVMGMIVQPPVIGDQKTAIDRIRALLGR